MFGLYVALMIVFGFIEAQRLDSSKSYYMPPAMNPVTGKQTTPTQAWIGRMIGDGLLLFAGMLIGRFIVSLF